MELTPYFITNPGIDFSMDFLVMNSYSASSLQHLSQECSKDFEIFAAPATTIIFFKSLTCQFPPEKSLVLSHECLT